MSTATGRTVSLLTWTLGDARYALNLDHCKEVDHNRHIVHVPQSRKYIAGIVNLRGDVVTVLDLRVLLGYAKKSEERLGDTTIVRVKSDDHHVALLADGIADVIEADADSIQPAPAHMSEEELKLISQVVMTDAGMISILKPHAFFASH